jgi:hypothetical protein
MALLTQELLKKKLSSWTLSSKVVETLGFEETQASEVKQELDALAEMGLVEREGERRGKKFRFKQDSNTASDEVETTDEVDSEDNNEKSESPTSKKDTLSLRAFFANRDNVKAECEGKTPLQLMSAITDVPIKDPSVLSHTLAYKRTSEDSIIATFWIGCVKQYEKEYTLAAFNKVLASELKALSKPATA